MIYDEEAINHFLDSYAAEGNAHKVTCSIHAIEFSKRGSRHEETVDSEVSRHMGQRASTPSVRTDTYSLSPIAFSSQFSHAPSLLLPLVYRDPCGRNVRKWQRVLIRLAWKARDLLSRGCSALKNCVDILA